MRLSCSVVKDAVPMHTLPSLRFRGLWLALGWALLLAIVIISLVPALPVDLSDDRDKLGHLMAYGTLMFWWSLLLPSRRARLAAALAFVLMGAVLEVLQAMTGYRSGEVADALANAGGVALGLAFGFTPLRGGLHWAEARL